MKEAEEGAGEEEAERSWEPALVPLPAKYRVGTETVMLAKNFALEMDEKDSVTQASHAGMRAAFARYMDIMLPRAAPGGEAAALQRPGCTLARVRFAVAQPDAALAVDADESYTVSGLGIRV